MILCSLLMLLGTYLRLAMENKIKITEVSWRFLYDEVSSKLHVKRQYVVDLHCQLVDEGCVFLFGHGDGSKRGPKEEIHRRLNPLQVQSMVDSVDDYHANGRTITNREIRDYLMLEHQITLSNMTISNYFERLGLTWKRVNNKRRGMGAYLKDLLRQFMIDIDKVMNNENCIIVGTDESYIHRNHCSNFSYVTKKEIAIGRSNDKGERLIIMHAISPHGPLAKREETTNSQVSDLQWKRDTCNPHPREDGKITCETIWKSDSRSGDYHNNMNSDMFMKWVVEKLLPSFKKLHPGKKMVLLLDNAPYHHKQQICNLTNKSKKQLVELCIENGVDKIDVKWNNNRVDVYANYNVDEDIVKFKDTTIKLTFNEEVFQQRPTTNQPFAPTVNELRLGIVAWLQNNRPDLLECMVTSTIEDAGHQIIWTKLCDREEHQHLLSKRCGVFPAQRLVR
jgi:hypothetical protein